MKTPKLTAALIVASAMFAAPVAFAEPANQSVDARFVYNPDAPATKIYADLNRTAKRACELPGTRSIHMQKHERVCMQEMVQDGVNKLGRSDVAAVHNGYYATASAGIRG